MHPIRPKKKKINSESSKTGTLPEQIQLEQVSEPELNYEDLQLFCSPDSLYSFKAPKGLFIGSGKDEYYSEKLKSTIRFVWTKSHFTDENGIGSLQEAIDTLKSRMKTTYSSIKGDSFVLSGYDEAGDIVYLKGQYYEESSMQGRDEGEPNLIWTLTGVLEVHYPVEFKKEFDRLIPLIMKTYTCDLFVLLINY